MAPKFPLNSPTAKTAILAFALSSWVEGLTQLRTVLIAPGLRREEEEEPFEATPLPPFASLPERFVAWLNRNGRRDVEINDTERATLAAVDTSTAFIILQLLGQPLLPFLLSPFLTTLPLPRTQNTSKSIRWSRLVLYTLLLCFVHEAQRVLVSLGNETVRIRRKARIKALLGDVYVRGDELRPRDIDEEEGEDEECLICAGVGADNTLSQSISSLSSLGTSTDNLGPLEAFCANAPQKHIAHRSCFLSWHAAYRQQRRQYPPEYVVLQHPVPAEHVRQRAKGILDAAGFGHLSRLIKFPHELPWLPIILPSSNTGQNPLTRPLFTLTDNFASSSTMLNNSHKLLATLHATAPPCPGCRSSVILRFFSHPPPQSRQGRHHCSYRKSFKSFVHLWIRHWDRLVTGKTVLYRLASQWSFVMALLSMLRVSHGPMRYRTTP